MTTISDVLKRLAKLPGTKRGGARPGAGRKPATVGKGRYQVTLSPIAAALARNLGDGNLSAGLERAVLAVAPQPPK